MTDSDLLSYTQKSLELVLWLSLPIILAAALIGLLIGLFQALTQIQDQTFSFVFKLIGVIFAIFFTAQAAGNQLLEFTNHIFEVLPEVRR